MDVQGRVTTSSGAKISGAEVTVDGQFDLTNKGGKYSIADVTAGTQAITASADGCTPQMETVEVIANQTAKRDFVLVCPGQ